MKSNVNHTSGDEVGPALHEKEIPWSVPGLSDPQPYIRRAPLITTPSAYPFSLVMNLY